MPYNTFALKLIPNLKALLHSTSAFFIDLYNNYSAVQHLVSVGKIMTERNTEKHSTAKPFKNLILWKRNV